MARVDLLDRFPIEISLRDGIGGRLSAPDHDESVLVRNVDPSQADYHVPKVVHPSALVPMGFLVNPALAMAPEAGRYMLLPGNRGGR
jgi:hypothetical protein